MRRVSSYLAFPPLPVRNRPAVYLCCTCPRVTPGGRYPLSLPCGARTFLTHGLSTHARGRSACSQRAFYPAVPGLSRLFGKKEAKRKKYFADTMQPVHCFLGLLRGIFAFKKMYHFHGVPFLRISSLFFAEKKGNVPTLYSPNWKAQKREEADLFLLPLKKAYFAVSYLPK